MTSDLPAVYLPGLTLKLATDTSSGSASSPGAVPSSSSRPLTVSLKQFDDEEFKLFGEGQKLSLLVSYTGGVKEYDVEEEEAESNEDDKDEEKEGSEVDFDDFDDDDLPLFDLEAELQKEDPNHLEVITKGKILYSISLFLVTSNIMPPLILDEHSF